MKANNGSGNVVERDEWQTKQELWDSLNAQYGFGFDCCAQQNNTKTHAFTSQFRTVREVQPVGWMNPPFSKAREMFEHFFEVVGRGVAIYRCDNLETKLWQQVILTGADWVFVPVGRLNYEGMKGSGSRFPSALIGVGVPPPRRN